MKWFKINNKDNFSAKEVSIQFSLDTSNNARYGYAKIVNQERQLIDLTIVLELNQENKDYFFELFDKSKRPGVKASDYKFETCSSEFIARGCIIKSITTDPVANQIVMEIRCDNSSVRPIEERRDEIIDEILDKTLKNKNI